MVDETEFGIMDADHESRLDDSKNGRQKITIWWATKIGYRREIEGTKEEINQIIHDITESDSQEEHLFDLCERNYEEDFDADLDCFDVEDLD